VTTSATEGGSLAVEQHPVGTVHDARLHAAAGLVQADEDGYAFHGTCSFDEVNGPHIKGGHPSWPLRCVLSPIGWSGAALARRGARGKRVGSAGRPGVGGGCGE
jgi:hypothetical protein